MRHLAAAALALTLLAPGCLSPKALGEADAHKKLGIAFIHENNDPAAIGELRQAVKKNKWDKEAWQLLGLAYFSYDRHDDAEAAFLKALKLDPEFAQAQVNLGSLYLELGRFKEAVVVLEQAADNPEYREPARARHNLAYAWLAQGDHEQARTLYQSVLRKFPNFCPGLHGLGMVAEAEGQLNDALGRYRAANECDPRDLKTILSLGQIEMRLDLVADACGHLGTVKDADPYGELRQAAVDLLDRLDCGAVSSR